MKQILKNLSGIASVSGNEGKVREYIISEIEGHCQCEIDRAGNLLVYKKGRRSFDHRLMLSAHMDEIGLIITGIDDDGYLLFSTVGGIDNKLLAGKRVVINNTVTGVIGIAPVHFLTDNERSKAVPADKLRIDIGAGSKSEAGERVSPGDYTVFDSEYTQFGDNMIAARGIDDKIGCAILIDIIKSEFPADVAIAFTVSEEIGLRGSKTAAYNLSPDSAIVIEATTAADIAGVPDEESVCRLKEGAVISFMDKATVYDKEYFELALRVSKEKGIKSQIKRGVAGGNDAGSIHLSKKGVRTVSLSLPCRYLHSPSCVICWDDAIAVRNLAEALSERILAQYK